MRTRLLLLTLSVALALPAAGSPAREYPRIANLWGCNPPATDYDKWSRYGMLVMGGGSPEAWRRFRREVRARNASILLLGTAPLMNLGAPKQTPWMKDEWFLRRPSGEKIAWWADQIYTPNLFRDECLEALLQQTVETYAPVVRDGLADGVFYDSVVGHVSWLGEVDTNGNGAADKPADVDAKWQARQCLFFDRVHERMPGVRILANDVDMGHAPHLNGRLYEGAPLLDRVAQGVLSPGEAIKTLNEWMAGALQPGITFAIMTHPLGWQGWRVGKGDKVTTPGEVERVRRDFRRMRLGLLTTLMTDAYFAYDFGTTWYGLPLWYAEYDAPLGKPLGPGREVFEVPPVPVLQWTAGQPAGAFALDHARATPEGIEGGLEDAGGGWALLFATDPQKVPLQPGKSYRIEAECEVLKKPTGTFQFNVRTGKGGWEHHDKGVFPSGGEAGSRWHIETTVVPDDFDDYAIEWHLYGAGALRLKSLKVLLIGESYYRRDFEGGVALLNTTPYPITIRLKEPLRRLADAAAPRHVVEVDDGGPGFSCRGAWQIAAGEERHYGTTHRLAAKPGDTARWGFSVPSTDTYTLFTTAPGGKALTDAAVHKLQGAEATPAAAVDQRKGDGGWVKLFAAKLVAGRSHTVLLRSGGTGATAADAIRAESAARYNDGAVVRDVALDSLDGAVLLRK